MQEPRGNNSDNFLIAEIAMRILELIYQSKPQELHKTDFVGMDNSKLKSSDDVVKILVDLDLIETESVEDLYYLTPEGYSVVEHNAFEVIINHPNLINGIDEEVFEETFSDDEQLRINNRKTRKFNGQFFLKWILYAIFIGLIYYYFV